MAENSELKILISNENPAKWVTISFKDDMNEYEILRNVKPWSEHYKLHDILYITANGEEKHFEYKE